MSTTKTTPILVKKNKANGKFNIDKRFNTLERLTVQYINIGLIKPNSYNPNVQTEHEFNLLLSSIEEDGFTTPIIVQQDYTIVDGEHRWKACKKLDFTEIPCVVVNMTDEQMRISTLRHNRARGSEDIDRTVAVLREIEKLGALEHAKDSLFIDTFTLDKLFESVPDPLLGFNSQSSQGNNVNAQSFNDPNSFIKSTLSTNNNPTTNNKTTVSEESNPSGSSNLDNTAKRNNNLITENNIGSNIEESEDESEVRIKPEAEVMPHHLNSKYTDPSSYISTPKRTQEEMVSKKQDWHQEKEARTEREKELIEDKVKIYRVQCMFSGKDAELVELILGDEPAKAILLLCKDSKLRMDAEDGKLDDVVDEDLVTSEV